MMKRGAPFATDQHLQPSGSWRPPRPQLPAFRRLGRLLHLRMLRRAMPLWLNRHGPQLLLRLPLFTLLALPLRALRWLGQRQSLFILLGPSR